MKPLQERNVKTSVGIQHLRRDALARYVTRRIFQEERAEVEWHLEHCHICEKEVTVRDIMEIAKEARKALAGTGSFRWTEV